MFTINSLPYGYEALEPVIDKETMEIHHDKHYQAYCDNLNKLVGERGLENNSLEELLKSNEGPIKNNAGGVWNHNFFWEIMAAPNTTKMGESLKKKIEESFGTVEEFMNKFEQVAMGRFGSGWAWVVINPENKLEIVSTANQDNPLVDNKKPILTIDVWEHAYYLKYKNRRVDYVKAFWQIVNWKKMEMNLEAPARSAFSAADAGG